MINTNLTAVTLNGNGSATSFPFSFWVPNAEALQCWITDATGVLSQTTDFTATLTETGGAVVYPASGGSALPNGSKITIMRNMPFTQKVDFVNGVSFLAEVVETALDDLTAQVQQVAEAATRAVKVPVSSTTDPNDLISQLEEDAATASSAASAATAQAQAAAQSATDAAASAAAALAPLMATAGGTANALTATLAAAPQTMLADRMRVRVRAAYANTGAATFNLTIGTTETGAVPIRKGALAALDAGDIAGAGHELDLQYNSTAGVWLVLNPAVTAGNAANEYVRLDSNGKIPAVDGSQLTNLNALPSQTGNDGKVLKTSSGATSWSSALNKSAAVASTSGTSIDFTGIPAWAQRVTVLFDAVSLSGSANLLVQLGSGSMQTSGYTSGALLTTTGTSNTNNTSGFHIRGQDTNTAGCSGRMLLENLSGNIWVASHTIGRNDAATGIGGGNVTLSGALDRIRITSTNGSDTFDAGSIAIIWE